MVDSNIKNLSVKVTKERISKWEEAMEYLGFNVLSDYIRICVEQKTKDTLKEKSKAKENKYF